MTGKSIAMTYISGALSASEVEGNWFLARFSKWTHTENVYEPKDTCCCSKF